MSPLIALPCRIERRGNEATGEYVLVLVDAEATDLCNVTLPDPSDSAEAFAIVQKRTEELRDRINGAHIDDMDRAQTIYEGLQPEADLQL